MYIVLFPFLFSSMLYVYHLSLIKKNSMSCVKTVHTTIGFFADKPSSVGSIARHIIPFSTYLKVHFHTVFYSALDMIWLWTIYIHLQKYIYLPDCLVGLLAWYCREVVLDQSSKSCSPWESRQSKESLCSRSRISFPPARRDVQRWAEPRNYFLDQSEWKPDRPGE